jgi:hypothetical protein
MYDVLNIALYMKRKVLSHSLVLTHTTFIHTAQHILPHLRPQVPCCQYLAAVAEYIRVDYWITTRNVLLEYVEAAYNMFRPEGAIVR